MSLRFLLLIFLVTLLMSPAFADVTLRSEKVNDLYKIYIEAENIQDLAAFQVCLSTNTKILSVNKGDAISNWKIFDYNITGNTTRIVGAKVKEESINKGTLAIVTLKAKDIIKINYSGILVNSAGGKIQEFSDNVIITNNMPIYTDIKVNKNSLNLLFVIAPVIALIATIFLIVKKIL